METISRLNDAQSLIAVHGKHVRQKILDQIVIAIKVKDDDRLHQLTQIKILVDRQLGVF